MTKLRLSASAVEGLVPLVKLRLTVVTALAELLRSRLEIRLSIDEDLTDALLKSDLLSDLDESERAELADGIYGLHFLRMSARSPDADVAKHVGQILAKQIQDDPVAIAEKIAILLDLPAVRSSVKAWSLLGDYERIYLSSRTMTDIRPVFSDGISESLSASLVVHTIKMTVRTANGTDDLYVAADSADVKELISDLTRSLEKAAALAKLLQEAHHAFGKSIEGLDDT